MKYIGKLKRFLAAQWRKLKIALCTGNFRIFQNDIFWDKSSKTYLSPLEDFIYKDENWEPVKFLPEVLNNAANHKNTELQDNDCLLYPKGYIKGKSLFICTERLRNNWLCFFYRHPLQNNYIFGFDIVIHTEFKEIQIAFKYRDLANRLRFMIRDNREAFFEVIKDGSFIKHVFSKPYSLKIGEKYSFRIHVHYDKFWFYINDELLFSVRQMFGIKSIGTGLCLILWQDNETSEINCNIDNLFII